MASPPAPALIASTIVPELSLLYMPYLFESRAEADHVLDTYLSREYAQLLGRREFHPPFSVHSRAFAAKECYAVAILPTLVESREIFREAVLLWTIPCDAALS